MKCFSIFIFLLIGISAPAQEKNKIITDEKTDKPMLIGYTTRVAFSDSNFSWWFDSEYEMYEPGSSVIEDLKGNLDNLKIAVIMGSWCSDSRREVPGFIKILDILDYPIDDITMISVDRNKIVEGIDISEYGVNLVPTIIFYKDDTEIGRIEEMPMETLENDMLKILSSTD